MFYDSRQLGKKKDWGPFTRMPRATASSWRNYSHILFSSLNFLYFPDFLQPSCMCFINTRDDKSTWCSTDPSRASICFLLYWNQMGWLPSPSSFLLHVGMNLCSPCGRGGGGPDPSWEGDGDSMCPGHCYFHHLSWGSPVPSPFWVAR